MDGGVPAAGHADQIAVQLRSVVQHHRSHALAADGALDAPIAEIGSLRRHRGGGARVDDTCDIDSGGFEVACRGREIVTIAEDHGTLARPGAVAVDESACGRGQHDAGNIVARKSDHPLVRTSGDDDPLGVDPPDPLARRMRRWHRARLAYAFDGGQTVVIVISEDRRARHDADVVHRGELRQASLDPVDAWLAVERNALTQERPAEAEVLIADCHARTAAARGERRRQSGRAAADHQNIAMQMAALVTIGIGPAGRAAQAGRAADETLVNRLPPGGRPLEGLVIEAGDENRRQQIVDRHDVEG